MNLPFDDQSRVDNLTTKILIHNASGFQSSVDYWELRMMDDYLYTVEGSLVSVNNSVQGRLYPCGTFECGHCRKVHDWNKYSPSFWNEDEEFMVCRGCKGYQTHIALPLTTCFVDMYIMPNVIYPFTDKITLVNLCISDKETYDAKINHLGNIMASTLGGVYFQNRNICKMREYFITKRIMRKMRLCIENKRRKLVFQILYGSVHMGLDAAAYHASKVII